MTEILTSSIFGNNVCGIIPSPVVGEIEYQMWDSYIAQNMTQGLFLWKRTATSLVTYKVAMVIGAVWEPLNMPSSWTKRNYTPSPNNLIINHLHLLQAENQSVFSPHPLS